MRSRVLLFSVSCVVASLLALVASADSPESPLDSIQILEARSPGERIAALDQGDRSSRLRAIRAAPFGAEPEIALPSLARLAAGRDPLLAPAAAVAAYRIATTLSKPALEAREADRQGVASARAAFQAVARDASARGDIRRLAGYVAAGLSDL